MNKFCYSCGAPIELPDFKGSFENFCKFFKDETGNLMPKDAVQKGLAEWLKMWQPNLNDEKALARAAHYMKAMPAWAE